MNRRRLVIVLTVGLAAGLSYAAVAMVVTALLVTVFATDASQAGRIAIVAVGTLTGTLTGSILTHAALVRFAERIAAALERGGGGG